MEDKAARKALLDTRNELSGKFNVSLCIVYTDIQEAKSKAASLRAELTQLREKISNLPRVSINELEAKISEAEESIETDSLSIKQERDLNTKIKGWKVRVVGCVDV